MNSLWLRIWNETGPNLSLRTSAGTDIPSLRFGKSFGEGYCGLSQDESHIVFPLFLGFTNDPFGVAAIPLPEIIDIVFFEKVAAFIAKIKYKLRGLAVQSGPISWDNTGFLENIICTNRDHIAFVNGFNDLIIDRMCEYLDVVLNDWNGEHSSGHVSHATFFTDATIYEDLLDELVSHQTMLGQMFAE